ncbi:hypothetical protein GBK04_08580 [Cytophagaceae bacterium SJW1-29]|uniref:Uncharacterized protein n=1 Tax=Salmonirosea aquatica TaxID=2654236 RepID=A0A7C9BHY1_9BACT|nr:hypothetical protein [Cytophagaceae bacterium SJW1-29]
MVLLNVIFSFDKVLIVVGLAENILIITTAFVFSTRIMVILRRDLAIFANEIFQ